MTTRKGFIALSLWVFMALSHRLFSQILLEGIVTDTGSEPVQEALVELIDESDPNRRFMSTTNALGKYYIQIPETGINEPSPVNPGTFSLSQNYPNPFNPSTVIEYALSQPADVRLEVSNILGRKVRTLFNGHQSASRHRIAWDALDDLGHGVPAGVYICTLTASGRRISRKMLLTDGHQAGSGQIRPYAGEGGRSFSKPTASDEYRFRVSGKDIDIYEETKLTVIHSMFYNVRVIRICRDIDGNVYHEVKIGDQWWLKENLRVDRYKNGEIIPDLTYDQSGWNGSRTGALCLYMEFGLTYGRLYNWYAVNDSRGLAPEGWHIPSEAEWRILTDYLGGRDVAGGKMKEAGTAHWLGPNTSATNESDFTALPGGVRSDEGFSMIGKLATFWIADLIVEGLGQSENLHFDRSSAGPWPMTLTDGGYVRCIRD
jgi:uncharacterized protein (TIGR02145 family)